MPFVAIFKKTEVAGCIENGLTALLAADRSQIINTGNKAYEGSVNVDECLKNKYPNDNRWDYAFGLSGCIYYVEFHSAYDSQVSVMCAKYQWLKDWQNCQPNPQELKTKSSYHWIASGKVAITKDSRYSRSLAKSGLPFPKRVLHVK